MLERYKQIYKNAADNIPGWKNMSKNELVQGYIDNEKINPSVADCYMGALICTYWNAINKYYRQNYKQATPDDCHEWLVHAIMYALANRPWLNQYKKRLDKDGKLQPNKSYLDPNGPDKVIKRCIASTVKIFYDNIEKDNRRANYTTYDKVVKDNQVSFNMVTQHESLDALIEDKGDQALPTPVFSTNSILDSWSRQLILDNFKQGKYFQSFVVDMIANGEVFDINKSTKEYEFNKKKLASRLRSIDDQYCKGFAGTFNLDPNVVIAASKECRDIKSIQMYKKIDSSFEIFRRQIPSYSSDMEF